MRGMYLISYSVRGVKTLDEWARLSFYKKTITKDFTVKNYNVKGIYGANGSGKSAIITSLRILRGAITDVRYFNDSMNQKKMNELVNKKLGKMDFDVEYLARLEEGSILYRYQMTVGRGIDGNYVIEKEKLTAQNATSHTEKIKTIFLVENGIVQNLLTNGKYAETICEKTRNLLGNASLTAEAMNKVVFQHLEEYIKEDLHMEFAYHFLFGIGLFAYLDTEDEHTGYFLNSMIYQINEKAKSKVARELVDYMELLDREKLYSLSSKTMLIEKDRYTYFEEQVGQLKEFLSIFKKDLKRITVDKRENKDYFSCELILHYDGYSVNAEFESTGIKKLIRLFPYLQKMVNGETVFIDELDSNLHDVYLCALLEYLMEYGKGQLCFTTHNIGPMDILKKNKKSLDFLSVDHHIYSWKRNGNYSPSKLYRCGMIEGSPFNIESVDFLSVFELDGDE